MLALVNINHPVPILRNLCVTLWSKVTHGYISSDRKVLNIQIKLNLNFKSDLVNEQVKSDFQ